MPRHKPPSRIRYERSHPTVSFRLSRELKERLKKALRGQSFADFIKEGLGVKEREKIDLEKAYNEGYEDAKEKFGIYTNCAECGERLIMKGEEAKREIEDFLRGKWYHSSCFEEEE